MLQVRFKNTYLLQVFFILCWSISCTTEAKTNTRKIEVGANQTASYLPLLKGKKVGVIANQTSVIFKEDNSYTHLVDSLLSLAIDIKKVFSPEHGFRGKADAAELVADGNDIKTGLPIVSLYGKNKKPTAEQLSGLDLVVFDIQDVGVRFYTYISTMHYVMEACAENNIPIIVLDRPNPNGHYVDGPILNMEFRSFVGMHPVPLVYGMTIGEYAQMINGEHWLKNNAVCELTVIRLKNYEHSSSYSLPIRPSPNLPNDKSINLYPSLGFFEGTPVNAGRGTEFQFQRYGSPDFPTSDFTYTPQPNFGSKYPKHKGRICNGIDLSSEPNQSKVNLKWVVDAYQKSKDKNAFFGNTFTIHAGSKKLEEQLKDGLTAAEIEASWQRDIEVFRKKREKYIIYNYQNKD
ncbi:DUF1343 domain-containing protein [Urechidicola sp. KH5]